VRDSVRRDIEQATQALAFSEQLLERLDGQRRLFIDFPRVMEEMRSGSLERVANALARLYEGGSGVHDLSRFLRDLPLALGHLAAAEAARRRGTQPSNGPQAAARTAEAPPADEPGARAAADESPGEAKPAGAGSGSSGPDAAPAAVEAAPSSGAGPTEGVAAGAGEAPSPFEATTPTGSATEPPASLAEPAAARPGATAEPVSPRVELRAKLLAAVPQLGRAAQTYRRNVATVRRATAPRRAPGPWRSDREVLEQARRALEFARQIFDAYAEAWADAPLPKNGHEAMSDEADRFLAWTQLIRYVELARVQPPLPSSAAPAHKEPSPDAAPAASSEEQEAAAAPEGDGEENRSGPAAG
jgi:hypothetical protein